MRKKSEETAQRILAATFQCISQRGCNNTGLREVASCAGVAMSQLNYYFTNREGLFCAVLEQMRCRYIEGLHDCLADCQSQSQRLLAVTQFNQQLLTDNRDLYITFLDFFGVSLWSDSFRIRMNSFVDEIANAINGELEQATTDDNRLAAKDPQGMTRLILSSSFGIALQFLISRNHEEMQRSFELVRQAIDMGRGLPSL